LTIAAVSALSHRLVQRDQRGQVLGVGETTSPGGTAEPVRDRSRDPAKHDVLMLPAPGAVGLGRPEDETLVRLERTRVWQLRMELVSIPTWAGFATWNGESPH
jgi:hypothetical protein